MVVKKKEMKNKMIMIKKDEDDKEHKEAEVK